MQLKHDQYFFIHIPKTAGTSFRAMLHENFRDEDIYPLPDDMKSDSKPYSNVRIVQSKQKSEFDNIKLINGHYPYSTNQVLNNPYTILFLRCPIKRTLSNVLHFKSFVKKYKKMPILQIINELPLIQTSNTYIRYLATNLNKNRPISPKDFNIASAALKSIDFVGTIDNYDKDIKTLSKLTGLELNTSIVKNVNKRKYQFSPKVYREIIRRNTEDLILYHNYLYKSY